MQSEEAKWGELVHLTAENYLNNRKQSQQAFVDQETLPLVKPFCDALVKAATGGTLLTEFEMAIDRKMQICGSRDWNRAWGRGIADVVIIKGDTAWVYDWKSGKPKEDMTQLKLFCAFLALHYPQIQHFLSKFIWLKTKTTTGMDKPITKAEILEVWKDILVRVRRMEEAWVNEIFPMRENGLCKNWCGVTSCPHCGK